jgi:hypothetical protein
MTVALCQGCTRPSPHAHACPTCIAATTHDLATLAWLDDELTTTRSRQARLAGATGRRTGGETPLPYGTRAAHVQDQLRTAVTTWARDIDPGCEQYWTGTVDVLCWVIARADLGQHPAIGELITDMRALAARGLEAVNPDPDHLAYGTCGADVDGTECDAHLHGAAGDTWVRCPRCRTQHETRERVEWMRRRMESLYLPAATLARLLPRLMDRPVSAAQIRVWAARGKPIGTARDTDGEPLYPPQYRVGDVITVAALAPTRERSNVA